MRYKLVVLGMAAAAFLGPSSSLLAAPLPCPATATDLGTYLAPNFSCTVNDKTISGMAASAPIGLAINVTPVTDTNNPGLEFTTSLNSGSFPISYTIAAPSTSLIEFEQVTAFSERPSSEN